MAALIREDYINQILDRMASFSVYIENKNNSRHYDTNTYAENYYAGLLNRVFGWNLENANEVHGNAPGIDLIDEKNRIIVQVSTTNTSTKIHHTIKACKKYPVNLEGYRLIMFFIIGKKERYHTEFDTEGFLEFDKERDIWDNQTIISVLQKISTPIEVIQKVCKYLNDELGMSPFNGGGLSSVSNHFIKDNRIRKEQLWQASKVWFEESRKGNQRFSYLEISETLLNKGIATIDKKENSFWDFPTVVTQEGTNGEIAENVINIIDNMKENLFLIGEGGIGKTTALYSVMKRYYNSENGENNYDGQIVPVFVELANAPDRYFEKMYNSGNTKYGPSSFICREIMKLIRSTGNGSYEDNGNIYEEDDSSVVAPIYSLFSEKNEKPQILLLLDGLNEVAQREIEELGGRTVQDMLVSEIERLKELPNIRIILTGRADYRSLRSFKRYRLLGVDERTIFKYLEDNKTKEDIIAEISDNRQLKDTLRNPLFLTLYALLPNKKGVSSAGEIFTLFFHEKSERLNVYTTQNRIVEIQEDLLSSADAGWNKRLDSSMQFFIMDFILPEIFWYMEKESLYEIGHEIVGRVIWNLLTDVSKNGIYGKYGDKVFAKYLDQQRKSFYGIKGIAQRLITLGVSESETVNIILTWIIDFSGLLYMDNYSFAYHITHENFRDYFAAVKHINHMRIALYMASDREVKEKAYKCMHDFNECIIGNEVARYIGESVNSMSAVDMRADTCANNKDANFLQRLLNIYQDVYTDEVSLGIRNIIEAVYITNHTFSGMNLSRLNLRRCSFNQKNIENVDFQKSLVVHENFFANGHTSMITAIESSPDGKYIVSGDENGEVILWLTKNAEFIRIIQTFSGEITNISFDENGDWMLVSSMAGTTLFKVEEENYYHVKTWKFLENAYISGNGKYILGERDLVFYKSYVIIDRNNMKIRNKNIKATGGYNSMAGIHLTSYLGFSKDSRYAYVGNCYGDIGVCDIENDQEWRLIPGFSPICTLSSDGRFLFSQTIENSKSRIIIRDIQKSDVSVIAELSEEDIDDATLLSAKFILNDEFIALCCMDGVFLWKWVENDINNLPNIIKISNIGAVCITENIHRQIILGNLEWYIDIFQRDALSFNCIQKMGIGDLRVIGNAVPNNDGSKLLICGEKDEAVIWNLEKNKVDGYIRIPGVLIINGIFDSQNERIALVTSDNSISVFETHTYRKLKTWNFDNSIINISFSSNGDKLFVSLKWAHLRIIDFMDDTIYDDSAFRSDDDSRYEFRVTKSFAAIGPNEKSILYICRDGIIRVFDIESQELISEFKDQKVIDNELLNFCYYSCVRYSSDRKYMLITTNRGYTLVWNLHSLKCIAWLKSNGGRRNIIDISNDGKYIVIANEDTIYLYETTSFQCVAEINKKNVLDFHKNTRKKKNSFFSSFQYSREIRETAFLPNGNRIISIYDDGTVKIWNLDKFMDKYTKTGKRMKNIMNLIVCEKTIPFVTGLRVGRANIKNLHSQSEISKEDLKILKMYGAITE